MRLFLTFFLAGLSQEIEPFQYEQYDYEYSNSLDRDLINIRGFTAYIFFLKNIFILAATPFERILKIGSSMRTWIADNAMNYKKKSKLEKNINRVELRSAD